MKTFEMVSLVAVMAVMVGFPLIAAERPSYQNIVHPCKPGQYFDTVVNGCTDCAVACHVPDSPDCVEFCTGVGHKTTTMFRHTTKAPQSTAPALNRSQLLALTLIPCAIIIVVLVAAVILYRVRKRTQKQPDPENGSEQEPLHEGPGDNEDGDLQENEDGENGRPEEFGVALPEESIDGDSLRHVHGQEGLPNPVDDIVTET